LLPGILTGSEFWCQGYSEPGAGSDLANVQTRARLDDTGEHWLISGQKVWTSLAHEADWCFVLARTEPGSQGHHGLSFLLVPMAQAQIRVQPIQQLTGTSEFNEVFFDQAVTRADNLIGQPGDGWKIAMALLGFERGVSTLGQQMQFQNELDEIIRIARSNGASRDPLLRQRIAQAWSGLEGVALQPLRMLSGPQDGSLKREAMIYKLAWSTWHSDLGKLAMDARSEAEILEGAPYQLSRLQSLFLFTRSDTIYGGSNEIQRNIIAERALGMPRERGPSERPRCPGVFREQGPTREFTAPIPCGSEPARDARQR
jgi:alkylation response protein AidB-like acyl-CoA dehydrogenase